MFAFLSIQAIQWVSGVHVLLSGVRLLLGEIVPAFPRNRDEIGTKCDPCIGLSGILPYSPNAVILGFITTTIGTIIAMFVCQHLVWR